MWAWAERQLAVQYSHVHTIPQLKAALVKIFKSVPPSILRNHVAGMRRRMEKVIKADGGRIDKK